MHYINIVLSTAALLFLCLPSEGQSQDQPKQAPAAVIDTFHIPDFKEGARLPDKWTCGGKDLSPPLEWRVSGANPKAYAIICVDPDAPSGVWTHWVIYNLPDTLNCLLEGVDDAPMLDSGAGQGRNDFGSLGYRGPCPPHGKPHRYFFNLYALSEKCPLKPGATCAELRSAMEGHILATKSFYGIWSR
ncbi:MAG: YbhB/YbcL family Raf kinase inhibitor-like protein [Calditrichaeota bacterium]|nr:YbhB/YbcL family Raf kinase inhibitor-like protein [Calditrichota bacterium]